MLNDKDGFSNIKEKPQNLSESVFFSNFENDKSSKNIDKSQMHFTKNFNQLKIKLNIFEKSRKYEFDSLLKRLKAKFFRVIHECLIKCLNDETTLKRIPQKFITDIKIPTNKKILNYTIEQIYSLNSINISFSFIGNQKKIIETNEDIYKDFIQLTFIEAYQMYQSSLQYQRDCEAVKLQESEAFYQLFVYISEIFINYYKLSKGNLMKKKIKNNSKYVFLTIQT